MPLFFSNISIVFYLGHGFDWSSGAALSDNFKTVLREKYGIDSASQSRRASGTKWCTFAVSKCLSVLPEKCYLYLTSSSKIEVALGVAHVASHIVN